MPIAVVCLLMASSIFSDIYAQSRGVYLIDSLEIKYLNWYNMSPSIDKIQGAEVNRVYNEILVNLKPKKKIVVAIIDSGTDYEHIDLQGRIWTNKKEIPNNKIDDDNNGYIDDLHGWGFLGNSKGENISFENVEQTRIYRDLNPIYRNFTPKDSMPKSQKDEFNMYLKSEKAYLEGLKKYTERMKNTAEFEKNLNFVEDIIIKFIGKANYTIEDLKRIQSLDETVMRAKNYLLNLYKNGFSKNELKEYKADILMYLEKLYNLDFNPRTIVGDNPKDINDKSYGNNDVRGPRSDHGTPVAGVIAAIRNNSIGVDGIAENVELMILRSVPRGDERDKDIALAIKYAVDNGANIINMSFGKDFSPQKEFIDDAIKYAQDHNVLLVHAAGNDGENIDYDNNFPTNILNNGNRIDNWITVGANSSKLNKMLSARFSNYGQNNVDLFAPGADMIVLYPGNKYSKMDGTSFAGPVVTGVSALVWSYYPELTALELKNVILKSTTNYPKQKVICPNLKNSKSKKVKFNTLSKTGGIVNAYLAMIIAEKVVKEKLQATNVGNSTK